VVVDIVIYIKKIVDEFSIISFFITSKLACANSAARDLIKYILKMLC
jgi:hypothetical protein